MRLILFAFILLNSALGFGQKAEFFVEDEVYKFPKTGEGLLLEHDFTVVNKGTDTLRIMDYKVACNCTKVDFPAKIAPGQSGNIHVSFDTKGKYYQQDRTIILLTNTKRGMEKLRFKVFVEPKKEE
jgi:Protein of unknown function (DUF1573)